MHPDFPFASPTDVTGETIACVLLWIHSLKGADGPSTGHSLRAYVKRSFLTLYRNFLPSLSGHLFEFTQDSKYLDAAIAGAEFIQNHMQEFPIIRDTFTVAGCQAPDLPGYTYITGFTIWGLSILSTYNSTWTSM